MKKIGILSMQRVANYGSFLQAFALKQMISKFGYEVEFVDYHIGAPVIKDPSESENHFIRKVKKGLETLCYRVPFSHKLEYINHKRTFSKKYMPLLGVAKEMNCNPRLHCLVIGSDEVFNCIQSNTNVGYSPELFGKNHRAKILISFAASFGNTTLEKLQRYHKDEEIKGLLKKFNAISVRDSNSGKIVKELTGIEPIYCLDPVLIYDYMDICEETPHLSLEEKYILLYAYSGRISKMESDWISEYAKHKGLKVYALGGIQAGADKFINCTPFEVLTYFNHAEEVITDTFHGSIFSIITHRPFTTLVRESIGDSYGNEEKLTDLLKRLGLEERMTFNISDVKEINQLKIDYNKVDDIIEQQRVKAYAYLKKNLSK